MFLKNSTNTHDFRNPIVLLRKGLHKHPKTLVFFCVVICIASTIEIYSSIQFGYANTSEAFSVDFDTFWENRPNTVFYRNDENQQQISYSYNSQGFRQKEPSMEISREKPRGIKRIITLGDSTTNGHGIAFENMYAEVLNGMSGDTTEVFSSAVPGFSAVQCRIQLEKKILGYHPDLITVAVHYNDRRSIHNRSLADNERYFYYASRLRWIMESLSKNIASVNALLQYKIHAMERKLKQKPPRLDGLVCRVPLSTYSRNLATICDIAKENHIRVVLIGLGDSFQVFENIFACRKAASFEEKVQYLLRERSKKNYYTYGLATLMLAGLIKREGPHGTGIDPDKLMITYQTVVSAIGGFVIKPDWIYRDAIKKVAKKKNVPYFDFVTHARSFDNINNGETKIYIHKDHVHLNVKGHKLLAQALYPILQKELNSE